jgi:hypothetical protein
MADSASDSPPARRPLGWKLLIPCLVLSLAALVTALFYAGRERAHHTSQQAEETAIQPTPVASQPAPTPRVEAEQSENAVIHRSAIDADDIEFGIDDMINSPTWSDRMREIDAHEGADLSPDDASPLGESADATWRDARVTVDVHDAGDGRPCVIVTRGNGFVQVAVGMGFNLKNKRVMVGADSIGDVFPQPAMAWMELHGTVGLSSWDWTPVQLPIVGAFVAPDRKPIVIEYDIAGRRGRHTWNTHGKVVLAR